MDLEGHTRCYCMSQENGAQQKFFVRNRAPSRDRGQSHVSPAAAGGGGDGGEVVPSDTPNAVAVTACGSCSAVLICARTPAASENTSNLLETSLEDVAGIACELTAATDQHLIDRRWARKSRKLTR